jgi:hypothetical protein
LKMFTKKTTDNNQQQPQPTTTNNNHNSSNNFIWYVFHWTDKAPSVEDERSSHYWYKNSSLRAWNHPGHVPYNSPLVDNTMHFNAFRVTFWYSIATWKLYSLSTENWSQWLLMVCSLHLFNIFNGIFSNSCPLISGYLPLNLT